MNDEEEQITTTFPSSAQQLTQDEPTSETAGNQSSSNTSPESDAPPPYEPASGEDTVFIPPAPTSQEDLLNQSPPLYSEIVKLPTYNESQNIESDSEESRGLNRVCIYFLNRVWTLGIWDK